MQQLKLAAAMTALACTAMTASAADVQIYGRVSTGLTYQNVRHVDKSTFGISNGLQSHDQSRFGLKGKEDLGNGLYVGFQLESGFQLDSGELADAKNDRLFDRVARLYVGNGFGEVSFGQMAGFTIAAEPYSIYARLRANMTTTSMQGFAPAAYTFQPGFLSNAIAFKTNAKNGFFVQGIYSNGDSKKAEDQEAKYDWSDRRHVGQLAAGWVGQQLRVGGVLSYEMPGNTNATAKKRDATQGLHLIASYDFGGPAVSTVFYHGKNEWRLGAVSDMATIIGGSNGINGQEIINKSTEGMTTNALFFSASYPMGPHTFSGALGGVKAVWKGETAGLRYDDGSAILGGVKYCYNFSKKTFAYSALSYARGDDLLGRIARYNQVFASVGMTHHF